MDAGGWIKLHRRIASSPMWLAEPFTRGQAWADLLMLANYTDGHVRIRGVKVPLKRGELGHAERFYSERWAWSRGKVRRFLEELETGQQIVQQKNNVTTLLVITNYDSYQGASDANSTANGPQTVQQTDHKRTTNSTANGPNKKKEKKEKKKKKEKKQGIVVAGDAAEVVTAYQKYHPRSRPGAKEIGKIRDRLAEGFTVADLVLAVEGCHVSPFHSGVNDRGAKYQTLELIVRDAGKVSQFVELAGEHGGPVLSEKTRRSMSAIDSWLSKEEPHGDA